MGKTKCITMQKKQLKNKNNNNKNKKEKKKDEEIQIEEGSINMLSNEKLRETIARQSNQKIC